MKDSPTSAIATFILGIGFLILVILYTAFSWGFVSYTFYNWFIHPNFTNLPEFSILQFIGFNMFIGVLTVKPSVHLKSEYEDQPSKWFSLVFSPWVSWLVGYTIFSIMF